MTANSKKTKFMLSLIIFSLIGQIAWVVENMYFNVFIYKMFHASPADISAMVMASAVAATVTTLIMGALSDKLGKRKIFISGGYVLWGISILAFAAIREDVVGMIFPAAASVSAICVTLVIVMDCVMTFFGSTANDACFNAWLTDATTHESRGAAEGINAMMPLVAILAVFGGFMSFDLGKSASWTLIFAIIGVAVTAIGVLGFFQGLAAILKGPAFVIGFDYVFKIDPTGWGWIHLIVGAVAIAVAVGLFLRKAMVLSPLYGAPSVHRLRFRTVAPEIVDE
jgi:MFS family permease